MRRPTLRFPVGQQFRKMLEDDHEWLVITDTQLHIIIARRGNKNSIPVKVSSEVFNELCHKKQEGDILKVYRLHTHPYENPSRYDNVPSPGDLQSAIQDLQLQNWDKTGIIIIGHGVITKTGIIIMKFPQKEERLEELIESLDRKKYINQAKSKFKHKLGVKYWKDVISKATTPHMDNKKFHELYLRSHMDTFKELIEKNPDIRVNTIRRTHRLNLRRRR